VRCITALTPGAALAALISPASARVQVFALTREELDEWTRMKFNEGKYRSSKIYGSPRDPQLKKEYQEYLKKRLEEIRKKRGVQK
jgi:hypothetical protein